MTDQNAASFSDQPWPQKGQKLFDSGGNSWTYANLGMSSDGWNVFSKGYKIAGDVLVSYVIEGGRDCDYLVYPIVFNYRQYLELRLKELIKDANALLHSTEEFPKHHELDKMWTHCRALLAKIEPAVNHADLEAIDESIKQFSEIDPSSQTFRYPIDKAGVKSLSANRTGIDLENLRKVMENVSAFLEAAEMKISTDLNTKEEIASYAAEYESELENPAVEFDNEMKRAYGDPFAI